jgi:ribosomal protein S27E
MMQFDLVLAVAWGIRTCLSAAVGQVLAQACQVSTIVASRAALINATGMCGHVLANASVGNAKPPAQGRAIGLPHASTVLGNSQCQGEQSPAQQQV